MQVYSVLISTGKTRETQQLRPDAGFNVALLRRATRKQRFKKLNKFVKVVLKVLKYVQQNLKMVLSYSRLNVNRFRLKVFCNASLAKNTNLLSELGFIIILSSEKNCQQIYSSLHKASRVTRIVQGIIIMVFADILDFSFLIEKDL